ncbi:MAG: hypothetical protein K6F99_06605 [Lachnospiraceae bacterium]|nr:hypothetical protein [Lachnospiraceae bacterium]
MWCPKCGSEYREGFTECAYCHVPLVEEEPVIPEDEAEEPKPVLDEDNNILLTAEEAQEEYYRPVKPYRTVADRSNDMRTSGYTLTAVGVLGLIILLLCIFGVIPIKLYPGIGTYMTYAVMGALFLLFTFMGIRSFIQLKELEAEAEREEGKITEIENWFLENYDSAKISEGITSGSNYNDMSGEYYYRIAFMKEKISGRFMDLEPAFMDYIVEELYQKIFDEK